MTRPKYQGRFIPAGRPADFVRDHPDSWLAMVSDNSADNRSRDVSKGDSICPSFTVQLPASVPRQLRRKGNIMVWILSVPKESQI